MARTTGWPAAQDSIPVLAYNDPLLSEYEALVRDFVNALQALWNNTDGLTVPAGGLTVTAGGLTVTAGGATITAGGLTVTAGGLTVNAGVSDFNDNVTIDVSEHANGGMGVSIDLTVDDNMSAASDAVYALRTTVTKASAVVQGDIYGHRIEHLFSGLGTPDNYYGVSSWFHDEAIYQEKVALFHGFAYGSTSSGNAIYGLLLDESTPLMDWGCYFDIQNANNYFGGGHSGFGDQTSPLYPVDIKHTVEGSSPVNDPGVRIWIVNNELTDNEVVVGEALYRDTTGTATNNLGITVDTRIRNSNGTAEYPVATRLISRLTDVTDNAEYSSYTMQTVVNGTLANRLIIGQEGDARCYHNVQIQKGEYYLYFVATLGTLEANNNWRIYVDTTDHRMHFQRREAAVWVDQGEMG